MGGCGPVEVVLWEIDTMGVVLPAFVQPTRSSTNSSFWQEDNGIGYVNFQCPLFSGGFPYPTIQNQDLLVMLKQGYRLEKPDNCAPEV
jgi:hypothetical protein